MTSVSDRREPARSIRLPACNFRTPPLVVVHGALQQPDRLVLRRHRVDCFKVVLGKNRRRRGNWRSVKLEQSTDDAGVLQSVQAAQANCSGEKNG